MSEFMTKYITITNGSYRNEPVNGTFPMVGPIKAAANGGFFVTVDASSVLGEERDKIRVRFADETDVSLSDEDKSAKKETDCEIMDRIAERFDILRDMTVASIDGVVRGMVVSGPPGIGKSFSVEEEINKDSLFDMMGSRPLRHKIVKGSMTSIGLYQLLYNYKDEKSVLVLDDCDSVLFDEVSLNLLKAALDSGKSRKISWLAESRALDREGIPSEFTYNGSIIFISNLKFDKVGSAKLKDHLAAIMSRCHYLDLTMDTTREKILRIKQIARDGGLFDAKGLTKDQETEIIDFMVDNKAKMRELSLRMAQKIADLRKISPSGDRWKRLAETTCMK